jgi:hypothetical protein
MTTWLRAIGVAIAVLALIDPASSVSRQLPLEVLIYAGDPALADIRERLERAVSKDIELIDSGDPAAIVAIGPVPDAVADEMIAREVPISWIAVDAPDVSIVRAPESVAMISGQVLELPVVLEGRNVQGRSSTVTLEDRDVEVARVTHLWDSSNRASVVLSYPVTPKTSAVRVRSLPLDTERVTSNNSADVQIAQRTRALQVAVFEPRPSWAAGFVRRALESDPMFQIAADLRLSRDVHARIGDPPRIDPRPLTPFDVVVVGAPEELRAGEVRALETFAETRGGAVVIVPDRAPSGPILELMPSVVRAQSAMVERRLPRPIALRPGGLITSEVVLLENVAARLPPGHNGPPARTKRTEGEETVAAMPDGTPVVRWWPIGDGRVVFSGALDAWRYRGDRAQAFTAFWRRTIAEAALAAPRAIEVTVVPATIGPHQRGAVTVRLRRTEFPPSATGAGVAAELVASDGAARAIRLWPLAEAGVFEGAFDAPAEGRSIVRVITDDGASAEAVLEVDEDVSRRPWRYVREIVDLTGGVVATTADLQPVFRHLEQLPRPPTSATIHPMRSPWWMVPFAAALCGEWALRRRRGLA